jgi:hypothetical protein
MIPIEDIPWIIRLRQEGNTWGYIAEEWDTSPQSVQRALIAAGHDPKNLDMGLPKMSLNALREGTGPIDGPYVIRGHHHALVLLPLTEYIEMREAIGRMDHAETT